AGRGDRRPSEKRVPGVRANGESGGPRPGGRGASGQMSPRVTAAMEAVRLRLKTRGFWLWLLLLGALCYFGSYYRHGLNFRDEGGTEALLAKRLLEGERPFLDLVLGYNLLWFYPIVGLFKLFGVNFV